MAVPRFGFATVRKLNRPAFYILGIVLASIASVSFLLLHPPLSNLVYSKDADYSVSFPSDWTAHSDGSSVHATGNCPERFYVGISRPEDVRSVNLEMITALSAAGNDRLALLREMALDEERNANVSKQPMDVKELRIGGLPTSTVLLRGSCETFDSFDHDPTSASCYRVLAVVETPNGFLKAKTLTTYGTSDVRTLQRIVKSFRLVPESERPTEEERRAEEMAKAAEDPVSIVRDDVSPALDQPAPADPERIAQLVAQIKESLPTEMPAGKPSQSDLRQFRACSATIGSLGVMKGGAVEAVPALVWAIRNSAQPSLGGKAATAIGDIGPAAKDAVPDLVAILRSPPQDDKMGQLGKRIDLGPVALALGKIGVASPEVLEALLSLVDTTEGGGLDIYSMGNDFDVFGGEIEAAQAFAMLGPSNVDAVLPYLIKVIVANESMAGYHAAKGLQVIGPAAAPAVHELIRMLEKDSNVYGRHPELINALGAIGPGAAEALPALQAYAEEYPEETRKAIAAITREPDSNSR